MKQDTLETLIALPRLNHAQRQTIPCKICRSPAHFFDVVDFNKHCSASDFYFFAISGVSVSYFRCAVCGFLFTTLFDDWTAEEFSRFVYNEDYIKVDGEYPSVRPEREAVSVAKILGDLKHLRILDYGSGSGAFACHLRAHGYDNVSCYDPFSSPTRPEGSYDVITCFEVLEHTTTPHATISDIAAFLDQAGCVIFSTGIQPSTINELRANWWYVAPRNGHVSIFTRYSLAHLAQCQGLSLHAGPSGTAFAGTILSTESKKILKSFGRPSRFVVLTAPGIGKPTSPDQAPNSWHGVESAGAASFRWTRESEILWHTAPQPFSSCDLTAVIPVANEIQPGFSAGCRLEIGQDSAAMLVRDSCVLSACFSIDRPTEARFKLVTPAVLRPCDLRSVNDSRSLGLAIYTGPQNEKECIEARPNISSAAPSHA